MKKICSIFTVFVIVFTVFNHNVSGQTKAKPKNSSTLSIRQKNTKFVIESGGENKDGNPLSKIFVSAGNKKIFIMDVLGNAEKSSIQKNNFKDMENKEIPKNALSACSSWWAGSGDYLHILPSKKGVKVFHGWRSEQQEGTGYHWKMIKKIAL